MTMASQAGPVLLTRDLETLRNAQMILTAAIQHAKEESLEPAWRDQILGLRLRLEKTTVALIGRELDQIEGSR
jgi:isocitrate/isopropylmalate dehydrogenase